eukprot:TRINITY_DN7141_c0_g2_i1.p1 TRINITY_DN7141_c0_g2~~TRINITY_DN7141_c0_g2_i1.p1  ORF type:complete len:636 (+),score=136.12 TRINITY_DN7141_c0_g2_i1:1149-3056(+)
MICLRLLLLLVLIDTIRGQNIDNVYVVNIIKNINASGIQDYWNSSNFYGDGVVSLSHSKPMSLCFKMFVKPPADVTQWPQSCTHFYHFQTSGAESFSVPFRNVPYYYSIVLDRKTDKDQIDFKVHGDMCNTSTPVNDGRKCIAVEELTYSEPILLNLSVGERVYYSLDVVPGQGFIQVGIREVPPTEPPTDTPTDPPTETPTDPPTDIPTEPPTEPPTDPPIITPTQAPTSPPSGSPTSPPSGTPTTPPSGSPTSPPSGSPSSPPSGSPTVSPPNTPTTPTNIPTSTPIAPTDAPTTSPTTQPTRPPTSPPTKSPVKTPTKSPIRTPTSPPTTKLLTKRFETAKRQVVFNNIRLTLRYEGTPTGSSNDGQALSSIQYEYPRSGTWHLLVENIGIEDVDNVYLEYLPRICSHLEAGPDCESIQSANELNDSNEFIFGGDMNTTMNFVYKAKALSPIMITVKSLEDDVDHPDILASLGQLPNTAHPNGIDVYGCNQKSCDFSYRIILDPPFDDELWYFSINAKSENTSLFALWVESVCSPLCELRGTCNETTGYCDCNSDIYIGFDCVDAPKEFGTTQIALIAVGGTLMLFVIIVFASSFYYHCCGERPKFDKKEYDRIRLQNRDDDSEIWKKLTAE